jgi:hypothetical protein
MPHTSVLGVCAPFCAQPLELLLSAPQAYLNGIDVPSIFFFKTLVVKLTGSVGAVAGGLAVGKEGPFVHAGVSQLMGVVLEKTAAARAVQYPAPALLGAVVAACMHGRLLSCTRPEAQVAAVSRV